MQFLALLDNTKQVDVSVVNCKVQSDKSSCFVNPQSFFQFLDLQGSFFLQRMEIMISSSSTICGNVSCSNSSFRNIRIIVIPSIVFGKSVSSSKRFVVFVFWRILRITFFDCILKIRVDLTRVICYSQLPYPRNKKFDTRLNSLSNMQ